MSHAMLRIFMSMKTPRKWCRFDIFDNEGKMTFCFVGGPAIAAPQKSPIKVKSMLLFLKKTLQCHDTMQRNS